MAETEENQTPAEEYPFDDLTISSSPKLATFAGRLDLSSFSLSSPAAKNESTTYPRKKGSRIVLSPLQPVGSTQQVEFNTASLPLNSPSRPSASPSPVRKSPRHVTPRSRSVKIEDHGTASPYFGSVGSTPDLALLLTPSGCKRKTANDSASPSKKKGPGSPSKKRSLPTKYADPSKYAHLSPIPDIVGPSMILLFIGLNPGVMTATAGHMYSHPTNHFWKFVFNSGITSRLLKPEEDRDLLVDWGCGNTNIVERPSRNGSELSKKEMDANVVTLEAKVAKWRPECVCIVGKSVWESIFRVKRGRALKKGEFTYGWQEDMMGVVKAQANEENEGSEGVANRQSDANGPPTPWEGARVFVATSTSGLAATVPHAEKLANWKEIGDWVKERRAARATAGDEGQTAVAVAMAEDGISGVPAALETGIVEAVDIKVEEASTI